MLDYELVNIWESLHEQIVSWIESVILEGWNLLRSKRKMNEISQDLVEKISLSLSQDYHINEWQLIKMSEKFKPIIYNWIDHILRITWDFFRDKEKFNEFSILISRDLIKVFLDNIKYSKK